MVESAGHQAALTVTGTVREVPARVTQNLLRIAQEALTNAARHAPGGPVAVELAFTAASVTLRIRNGPATRAVTPGGGSGMGLIGMRERVALLDGTVGAGPVTEAGRIAEDWTKDDSVSAFRKTVQAQTALGKRFERVRLVDAPPTTGQRYLLEHARWNIESGEDIRNMRRTDADRLRLPAEDFWLFDSRLIALVCFDDDQLTHVELITEPAEVVRCCMIRDAAWHHRRGTGSGYWTTAWSRSRTGTPNSGSTMRKRSLSTAGPGTPSRSRPSTAPTRSR